MNQSQATIRRRSAGAQFVTEVFSPVYLAVGILLVVGAVSTRNPALGAGWGLLAALLAIVIPYGFLLHGVRQGRYSDRHVRIRQQRTVPLLIAGAGVIAALALLALLGAPRQLVALVIAMLAGQLVTLAITLAWKISVHTGVAAGVAAVLTLVFGPFLLLSWPAVALVAWARVQLHDHTLAQVIAGAVMGGSIAATVFSALR
jgi:membrane-associated phospholipid phosphatase